MKLRGFSPGTQPMNGFVRREDDSTNQYYDILIYDRNIGVWELDAYELDYIGTLEEKMNINDVVNNVKVYDLDESLKAAKYAKSVDVNKLDTSIKPFHTALAKSGMGQGHDNFLLGIRVNFDLTFTIKAWTEAERYHFFDIITSQSTMHKIHQMDIASNCIEYVDPMIIKRVEELKKVYNDNQTIDNFLNLVYNVPVGFKLTARIATNYRQLKTIYYQRKSHRLPEWQIFCSWIETLPMFKELVLGDNNDEN